MLPSSALTAVRNDNGSWVEPVGDGETVFAYVVRAGSTPNATTFLTPDQLPLQLGFIVYPRGGEVARHYHKPLERQLQTTTEVLIVQRGACELDIYDASCQHVATRTLGPGDVVMLCAGGHGLRMTEDTVLLEVKQGPYTGVAEKVRF